MALTCTSDPSKSSEACRDLSSFVRTPIFQIDVWKRKADVSYNVQNFSIELIENMSPIYETDGTEAKTYLDFYDRIFPRWKGRAAPGSLDVTLESLLYNFCFTQCAGSPFVSAASHITQGFMEMLLLPYLVQQEIEYESGGWADREHGLTSMYCTKSYQLSVAPSSFYIFALFCFITILWCLRHLRHAILHRRPILSGFPEIDFPAKWVGDNQKDMMLLVGTGATSEKVEKIFGGMKIYVRESLQDDEDVVEMNTL